MTEEYTNQVQTAKSTVESNVASLLGPSLVDEISRMRRNPAEFTLLGQAKCKLCYKKTAYDLGHANNPTNAGTWCPEHGWLWFDSVSIPPTERLRAYEVEERKEAEKRKIAWQKRQDKKNERLS